MPHSDRVKYIAQALDPECWVSYAGRAPKFKAAIDERRSGALARAEKIAAKHPHATAEEIVKRGRLVTPVGRISFPGLFKSTNFTIETSTPVRPAPPAGRASFSFNASPAGSLNSPPGAEVSEYVSGYRNMVRRAARDAVSACGKDAVLSILQNVWPGATNMSNVPDSLWPIMYQLFCDALKPKEPAMPQNFPPLKIQMMLHFATVVGPFAPERTRRSEAYTTFVKELLRDGMIIRPTNRQREEHPGWAYQATSKGRFYVDTLRNVPMPVQVTPEWAMPKIPE